MFNRKSLLTLTWTLFLVLFTTTLHAEVPKLIDYQGRLTDPSGKPLPDTTIDITFSIYRSDGTVVWTSGPQPVTVIDGLFRYSLGANVALPYINISSEFPRFLGIKVGDDPELTPREQLVSVPYSYRVGTIDGAAGGSVSGTMTLLDAGYTLPTSDGAAGQFMTTDGVGNLGWSDVSSNSYWYVSDSVLSTSNYYGLTRGSASNALYGTTVHSQVNFGVACTTGVVSTASSYITISGGYTNLATGNYSTIAGGRSNEVHDQFASVGGGYHNQVNGPASGIGGGQDNTVNGTGSTIGGGFSNAIDPGTYCTISGGSNNQASGMNSAVGGGRYNIASNESMVPGGAYNEAAGARSFAAGRRAKAMHHGSYVWADNTDADFSSTAQNQYLVRAAGGVGINTASPTATLDVNGTVKSGAGFAFPDNSIQLTAAQSSPIGSVTAWLKSFSNTPSLPPEWVECNGQTLSDSESPYDGLVIPNLNGESRFLRGYTSSGGVGGAVNHNHEVQITGYAAFPGTITLAQDGTYTTDTQSNMPPYYRVVWIMKVK